MKICVQILLCLLTILIICDLCNGFVNNYKYKYNYNYKKNFFLDKSQLYVSPLHISETIFNFNEDETIYTLIWKECDECKQLLSDIKEAKIKIFYIDGSYYFIDEPEEHLTNNPVLYKNEELIAINIFDIYKELFYYF